MIRIVAILGPYVGKDRLLKQMATYILSMGAYPLALAACEDGANETIRNVHLMELSGELLKRLDPKTDAVLSLEASARSTLEVVRAEELGLPVFWGTAELKEWIENADSIDA